MPVAERERLVTICNDNWQNTPAEQFNQELASLIQETHRFVDPYYYSIASSGEFWSPTKHCKVKDTIDDITSRIGQLEYQAVLAAEQLAAGKNEGAIVWISPPYAGRYTGSKIIVHEIKNEGGRKGLFNRAIVLDLDEVQCLKLAWNLTSFSQNKPIFTHADQVRVTPLFLPTKDKSWINIMEKFIDNPDLWQQIRDGEDIHLKNQALRQAAIVQKQFFAPGRFDPHEAKMAVLQVLGSRAGSCPPTNSIGGKTALTVVSENSVTYVASSLSKDPDFCKNCPVCGEEINCIVRTGESCPKCRVVKRCG